MTTQEMRKILKISQEKLARELDVSLRTVAGWESGEFNPSPLAQEKLVAFERKYRKELNA